MFCTTGLFTPDYSIDYKLTRRLMTKALTEHAMSAARWSATADVAVKSVAAVLSSGHSVDIQEVVFKAQTEYWWQLVIGRSELPQDPG